MLRRDDKLPIIRLHVDEDAFREEDCGQIKVHFRDFEFCNQFIGIPKIYSDQMVVGGV